MNEVCAECLGTEMKGPRGMAEAMTSCETCGRSLHQTCANLMYKGSRRVELTQYSLHGSKWYCDECRICDSCNKSTAEKGPCLLSCCTCHKSFHFGCLNPVPEKKVKCPWRCEHCLEHHDTKSTPSRKLSESATSASGRKKTSNLKEKFTARHKRM